MYVQNQNVDDGDGGGGDGDYIFILVCCINSQIATGLLTALLTNYA
jgi:hypothetical protein